MSEEGNAFKNAAGALAKVQALVLKGDVLTNEIGDMVKLVEAASQKSVKALTAESAALSKTAEEVLGKYREVVKEISAGIRSASEQLETATTQIKAHAIDALNEMAESTGTAVKRTVAEVTIASDKFGKSVDIAANRVTGACLRVEDDIAKHSEKLDLVLTQNDKAFKESIETRKIMTTAIKDVRSSNLEMIATKEEIVRTKEEIISFRARLITQSKIVIIVLILLSVFVLLIVLKNK